MILSVSDTSPAAMIRVPQTETCQATIPKKTGVDRRGEGIDKTLHRRGIAGREDVHDDIPFAPLRRGEREGDADRPQEGDDFVSPPVGGVEDPEDHVARGEEHECKHGRAA